MGDGIYISASGAVSRLHQLETVANNLANADTTGFKADRAIFHAALASALNDSEGGPVRGAPGRVYVSSDAGGTSFAPGGVSATGAPLDAAIQGRGFFAVEGPEGVRYTRAGSFAVNTDGLLSTPGGLPVLGEGGPISVGDAPARIRASGEVVSVAGESLGRLRVVEFDQPALLQKEGETLFRAPAEAVGIPSEDPEVVPGSIERSNVEPVRELAVMMILQRSFEATMQVLQSDDQATQSLIQEISE